MKNEDDGLLLDQETLYWNSEWKWKSWYRKLYGGHWRLIKIGRDTPNTRMFATWTKMNNSHWSGHIKEIETADYPYTGIRTKNQLRKAILLHFLKYIFNKVSK